MMLLKMQRLMGKKMLKNEVTFKNNYTTSCIFKNPKFLTGSLDDFHFLKRASPLNVLRKYIIMCIS